MPFVLSLGERTFRDGFLSLINARLISLLENRTSLFLVGASSLFEFGLRDRDLARLSPEV